MNGWDLFTWLCAVALAATAVVIFGFFLRDAGSILNREMRDRDEEPQNSIDSPAATWRLPDEDEV